MNLDGDKKRPGVVAVCLWLAVGIQAHAQERVEGNDANLGVKYSSVKEGDIVTVRVTTRNCRLVAVIDYATETFWVQSMPPSREDLDRIPEEDLVPVTEHDIRIYELLSEKLGDVKTERDAKDALLSMLGIVVGAPRHPDTKSTKPINLDFTTRRYRRSGQSSVDLALRLRVKPRASLDSN